MNKSNRRLSIFLIAAIGISSFSSAQQLEPILKELIQKGLEKSHAINIHNLDSKQAKVDQKLAYLFQF